MPGGYRHQEYSNMHGSFRSVLTMVPMPSGNQQDIAGLQDLIKYGLRPGRRNFRHAFDGMYHRRVKNLPALRALDLDDDEVLGIIMALERAVGTLGYDDAGKTG